MWVPLLLPALRGFIFFSISTCIFILWFYGFTVFLAGNKLPLVRDLEHLLFSKVRCNGSCSWVMVSPALCRTVEAVDLRYLLQTSLYVAAALSSSEGREVRRLLACACCVCSARYKNLPVLFPPILFLYLCFHLVSFRNQSGSVQQQKSCAYYSSAALLKSNISGARDSSLLHLKSFSLLQRDDFLVCTLTQRLQEIQLNYPPLAPLPSRPSFLCVSSLFFP